MIQSAFKASSEVEVVKATLLADLPSERQPGPNTYTTFYIVQFGQPDVWETNPSQAAALASEAALARYWSSAKEDQAWRHL